MFGHVALCISKGRLALFTDNKTKVGNLLRLKTCLVWRCGSAALGQLWLTSAGELWLLERRWEGAIVLCSAVVWTLSRPP